MKQLNYCQPSYDGTANIETFDQFVYEFNFLCEVYDLSDRLAVKFMINYVTGQANRYIRNNVLANPKGWTVRSVYMALFEHCFPSTYKECLRHDLMSGQQGHQTIEDFENELRVGARRFGDIPERSIVQTFWDGVHQYIRVHWHSRGYSPEETPFDQLVKHAKRAERMHMMVEEENRIGHRSPEGHTWTRFKNRT
ncbi:hypothetical protein L218DRAFT_1023923 [Marasmius fiardii PR-910]|nr:hypothetical protein L218DRAFT_1023923 [Marasmius fiardii PR-910]